MGRIVELLVLINALGGVATLGARYVSRKRRASNVDRIRELERENAEIDRILDRSFRDR